MKPKYFFILAILAVIFLGTTLAYFLFFYNFTEDQYNKIVCYYIARKLTDDCATFNDKIITLRDFVHENVHPIAGYYNRLDTVGIDKLISGIGWCDQQSRVFMQLAHNVGITTRLLFLRLEGGGSPHTVAEALAPDKRWIIVDAAYKLDLVNKNGDFASQDDIKKDLKIVSDNRRVKLRSQYEKQWSDDKYLSVYSNEPQYIVTRKGIKCDFLKFIPVSWMRPIVNIIQNRYLDQARLKIKSTYKFKMSKARAYHLLGYYEKSITLYDDVILNSGNPQLTHKAEFYHALALKEEKRYEEAYRYITSIINKNIPNNPYIKYLYGLRAEILNKMGRSEEAQADLLQIEYMLEA